AVLRISFASAAICSVSSVMKFSSTQEAREALLFRSYRRCSASSMNFLASSGVGAAFACPLATLAPIAPAIAQYKTHTATRFHADFIVLSLYRQPPDRRWRIPSHLSPF